MRPMQENRRAFLFAVDKKVDMHLLVDAVGAWVGEATECHLLDEGFGVVWAQADGEGIIDPLLEVGGEWSGEGRVLPHTQEGVGRVRDNRTSENWNEESTRKKNRILSEEDDDQVNGWKRTGLEQTPLSP